jgi:hypothetical protein
LWWGRPERQPSPDDEAGYFGKVEFCVEGGVLRYISRDSGADFGVVFGSVPPSDGLNLREIFGSPEDAVASFRFTQAYDELDPEDYKWWTEGADDEDYDEDDEDYDDED